MNTSSDTESETSRRITRLKLELDERETFAGYARLYAAIAVVMLFLLFLPILADVTQRDSDSVSVTHYGTLWEMSKQPGGGAAVLGILLAVCLAALAAFAAFRPRTIGPPIGVAIASALVILMLIAKPGTEEPTPDRTPQGNAGLALAIAACCLGIIHAIHVARKDR